MGRGFWRGCHSFVNIICDGQTMNKQPGRSGGLRMGEKYWYYVRKPHGLPPHYLTSDQYKLNGDIEYHNTAEASTTSCPSLPGQPVNVVEIPLIHSSHSRSTSASSNTSSASEIRTMNPEDKYLKPRAAPLPRLHTTPSKTSLLPASSKYPTPPGSSLEPPSIHETVPHPKSAVISRRQHFPRDESVPGKSRSLSPPRQHLGLRAAFQQLKDSISEPDMERGRSGYGEHQGEMQIGNPVLISRTDEERERICVAIPQPLGGLKLKRPSASRNASFEKASTRPAHSRQASYEKPAIRPGYSREGSFERRGRPRPNINLANDAHGYRAQFPPRDDSLPPSRTREPSRRNDHQQFLCELPADVPCELEGDIPVSARKTSVNPATQNLEKPLPLLPSQSPLALHPIQHHTPNLPPTIPSLDSALNSPPLPSLDATLASAATSPSLLQLADAEEPRSHFSVTTIAFSPATTCSAETMTLSSPAMTEADSHHGDESAEVSPRLPLTPRAGEGPTDDRRKLEEELENNVARSAQEPGLTHAPILAQLTRDVQGLNIHGLHLSHPPHHNPSRVQQQVTGGYLELPSSRKPLEQSYRLPSDEDPSVISMPDHRHFLHSLSHAQQKNTKPHSQDADQTAVYDSDYEHEHEHGLEHEHEHEHEYLHDYQHRNFEISQPVPSNRNMGVDDMTGQRKESFAALDALMGEYGYLGGLVRERGSVAFI